MSNRYRAGKTVIAIMAAKAAQKQGKRVLWLTNNQVDTATILAKHGALSELVNNNGIIPHFRKEKKEEP